jgi:NAD-dependent dihydropyrimidine dehydrogenase PreA subunit
MGIAIDSLKCTGCGSCVFMCPAGVLAVEGTKCRVLEGCTSCGACVDACSFKAIKLEKRKKTG